MADDTFKSFLVKLGFKVDDGSLKNFQRSVDVVTSQVTAFAATVAATTASVAIAVEKWSKGFEDLYYASQRTGASAKNIKAFEYALSQVGGTAEGAHAAVESLARFIRNSPGAEGWLKSNGVATRDAAGRMRDTVDILKDFAARLKGQPQWRQNVLAEFIGLDEKTRQAMARDFQTFEQEYTEKLKRWGLNADEASAKAQKMQQQFRSLREDVEIMGVVIIERLAGVAQELISWFSDLSPRMATIVEGVVGLTIALRALWLAFSLSPVGAVIALGTALMGLLVDYEKWKDTGKSELPWANWEATLRPILSIVDRLRDGFSTLFSWWGQVSQPTISARIQAALTPGATRQAVHDSRIASAMSYFIGQGWTRAQASGIVANLDAESGMDPLAASPDGVSYGLAQWIGSRRDDFKRWAGKDIHDSTSLEQEQFLQYELTKGAYKNAGAMLRATQNAGQAAGIVSRYVEKPLNVESEAARRGAAAMTINNSPVINVHGSGDPHATAAAVGSVQNDVNERLARDLVRNPQ